MAGDTVYGKTEWGEFELKELPPATTLTARSEGTYFGEENGLFMKLFGFIRANEVGMTVPVEVELEPGTMRFFVGENDARKTLKDTTDVSVGQREADTVASHGVRGAYSEKNARKAIARLEEWLAQQPGVVAVGAPYMVYWNSPLRP